MPDRTTFVDLHKKPHAAALPISGGQVVWRRRRPQTLDRHLLRCCIDGSAKLAGEGHSASADRVARVELAGPDLSPDGVEHLGEAIKRIRVELPVGVSGLACLRPERSRALS